ncbi:hypothetical protein [Calothrix rhizosoleniae]|uniref:hypothetical protein n=1 Tax=Calothrix rhizosoleniae TaxID=888997 RepID=UPI00135665BE|nr:hypothetical protein [Calothrix rhizosoleniae]
MIPASPCLPVCASQYVAFRQAALTATPKMIPPIVMNAGGREQGAEGGKVILVTKIG